MDFLTKIFNILKNWFYELLAVLVPGSVLVAVLPGVISVQNAALKFSISEALVIFAYVAGILSQGLSDLVTRRLDPPRATNKDYKTCNTLREQVAGLVNQKLSAATVQVPIEAVLGICLTHVDTKREVYDKFLALRDMSRGLMVSVVAAAAILLWRSYASLEPWQVAGVAALALGAAVAFYNRYRRYQPLAEQALYEVFLAMELKDPTPAAEPAAA